MLIYTAEYITGAHRADSLSLDGAVRQVAHMLDVPHTELWTEQSQTPNGRGRWAVFAPGEQVAWVTTEPTP